MSFASLGPVVFEASADRVRTWSEARRSREARYATHDVHLGKPKLEFLGLGLSKMDLSIRFDAERGVIPRDEIRRLADLMDLGQVLAFTVGGEPVGAFVLKSMSEVWRRVDANGILTTAVVDLSLEEYAS